jgi:hypothetical protein
MPKANAPALFPQIIEGKRGRFRLAVFSDLPNRTRTLNALSPQAMGDTKLAYVSSGRSTERGHLTLSQNEDEDDAWA